MRNSQNYRREKINSPKDEPVKDEGVSARHESKLYDTVFSRALSQNAPLKAPVRAPQIAGGGARDERIALPGWAREPPLRSRSLSRAV